ncbi:hypothetical protein [Methylobacterium sp. A54F]
MPEVLSFRARSDLREQIRAAARQRGEPPGEYIRRAVQDRISSDCPDMTREALYAALAALREDDVSGSDLDTAVREYATEKLPPFRQAFFERLIAAHRHLGLFLAQQAAVASADPNEGAAPIAAASGLELVAAFGAMDEARELRDDLVHLVVYGSEA